MILYDGNASLDEAQIKGRNPRRAYRAQVKIVLGELSGRACWTTLDLDRYESWSPDGSSGVWRIERREHSCLGRD